MPINTYILPPPAFLAASPWAMEPKALGELTERLMALAASPSAPLPSEKTDVKKKSKSKSKPPADLDDEPDDDLDKDPDDDLDDEDEDGDDDVQNFTVFDLMARVPASDYMDGDGDPLDVDEDGVCTINVVGALTKEDTFYTRFFGGTSTDAVVKEIAEAEADPSVKAILLNIDSPGGQAAGMVDLFSAVRGATKPTAAYIGSIGASAAYWAASGTKQIFAGALSIVGSIGTYMVVPDTSKAAANVGVKVNVVSSGGMKGAGVPGTKVTPEQLADVQRVVNSINSHFIDGVAQGRGMSRARVTDLADGRVHVGAEAKDLGLVDGIGTVADAKQFLKANMNINSAADIRKHYAAFAAEIETEAKAAAKAEHDAAVKAAEVKAHEEGVKMERERIKMLAECPTFKADLAFVVARAMDGSELGAAKTAYADVLAGKVAALEKAAADAKARQTLAEAAHPQSTGADSVPQPGVNPAANKTEPATPAAAKAKFNARVNELVEKNKMSRKDAVAYISKNERDVYDAMMASYNPAK